MADLIIRGMEMPKNGYECPMNSFGICHVATDGENCECYDVRPEWCPLLPLPKGHGRLIDADALDRAFTDLRFNSDGTLNHWGDRPCWCMHGYEVEKLIADAPTIVPAEGGTE